MDTIKKTIALGALIWAIALSTIALLLPPKGIIDSSVLILVAQILVLVASILGFSLPNIINYGNRGKKKVAS